MSKTPRKIVPTDEWRFNKSFGRPVLSEDSVSYWLQTLKKLLKVGVELEYNLPEKNGTCDRSNYLCPCTAEFRTAEPQPSTSLCYEQCSKWAKGDCTIAKEHGCANIYCLEFTSPCSSCSKYDRGCATCNELFDLKKDPARIRTIIGQELKPTRFVGDYGTHGVYKVCIDNSLLGGADGRGGIEIATVGRRLEFSSLYDMLRGIMSLCKSHGAYLNERCSIHIHLLASYLTPQFSIGDLGGNILRGDISELEMPVPEIILANFHQLIRKYQCALTWLSMAGTSTGTMTRWEKFRKSILPYSAALRRMSIVTEETARAGSKRKYAFMNYEQVKYNKDGDITRLHVEGRHMDGSYSPAAVVAHACLLYGLMLKAVEISRYGVLESGSMSYMSQQRQMFNAICNNDGDYGGPRNSDTSSIIDYIPELQQQSNQLIRLVKFTLKELFPSDQILASLAAKPQAYHLIEGRSWEEIENILVPKSTDNDEVKEDVMRLVNLSALCECRNEEEWVELAISTMKHKKMPLAELRKKVTALLQGGSLQWSASIGTFIAG